MINALTRVPKHWLIKPTSSSICAVAFHKRFLNNCDLAEQSHVLHDCGVDTTLHFARKLDPVTVKVMRNLLLKTVAGASQLIRAQ